MPIVLKHGTFAKYVAITRVTLKSQIFELKSQNRNLNSLLCEIFTYMAVKIQRSRIQQEFEKNRSTQKQS